MLRKLRTGQKKGFTTLELMIVIATIALLAAIAFSNSFFDRPRSYCSKAESDAKSVAAEIANYFSEPTNVSLKNVTDAEFYKGYELSNANTVTVDSSNVDNISITVTDTNNCPRGTHGIYVLHMPENKNLDGWW